MFRYFLGLCRFLVCRKSPSAPLTARKGESRHILVLGSLGVGKSSLVNMLVGRPVAPVSDDIGVAHPAIVEYPVSLREMLSQGLPVPDPDLTLRFYDTVGLEHRPAPWGAINARLKRSDGADVVVYCMRRGRLSNEQVTHLRTISNTYCRGDVPLLLVVSGVDFRHGSTERWWGANVEDLKNSVQVGFADHICLNTWDPTHPSWKRQSAKYEETQRLVRDLVIRHCKISRSTS